MTASTKPAVWRCLEAGCGASGEALTRRLAVVALEAHFGAAHNDVPWMEDE